MGILAALSSTALGAAEKAEAASKGLRQLHRRPVLLAPECFQKQGAGVSLCGALECLIEDEMMSSEVRRPPPRTCCSS